MKTTALNILMITHHRRFKARARAHAMAKHLVQRGHAVSLMVIADERKFHLFESEWDGVHVIETPDLLSGSLRSGWDVWDTGNRIAYLMNMKRSYDLVHCFETRPATIHPARIYARQRNIPLLTDWNDWWGRGGLIDEVRPAWYRLLFGGMETFYEEAFRGQGLGTTVISTALFRRAEKLGIPTERILHLPGGAFPEQFPMRDKTECRTHVGLPPQIPILGFSSLDSHLDLELVFHSLRLVARRFTEVKLLITGNASNVVRDLIKTQGLEKHVLLTGYLSDSELPWVLGCADVFLLPLANKVHNAGRWPNKLCDYMSLGRPTVANPVGDVRQVFEKHDIGLLADWDADDFAQKILFLLDHPEHAATLGRLARHTAETVFDWRLMIQDLERFYFMMLAHTRERAYVAG